MFYLYLLSYDSAGEGEEMPFQLHHSSARDNKKEMFVKDILHIGPNRNSLHSRHLSVIEK